MLAAIEFDYRTTLNIRYTFRLDAADEI
jgi:hypothetical protein